ncbi:hypothetical protein [Micromonospora polyrhachis]|uniref:Uncharacterized protein n=1 Tax=Micromonospora polyrhachis TaxID=1282883 RepID=A0A7W7SQJ9_9ACTN|nr:hypothetical protein [Micromonospora polyrhachis]MBB4957900.1 hypothetical protein [Micromonospora polyrhachis]
MQPTENKEQATQTVKNIVQEAFQQLPPGAELEMTRAGIGELPCDDPTDGGPAGRIFIEIDYQVRFKQTWPSEQTISILAGYWERHNYKIVRDSRAHKSPQLVVERRDDGYRVIIELWDRGGYYDVYLGGSSPCVWETGTPDPQ